MPSVVRSVLGSVLALALLPSCGGDDGPWKLRPNVTTVLSSEAAIIDETIITDVDREGDRIVLLRPSSSTQSTFIYVYLSLSDDLGKTWRHLQVPREVMSELGGDTHQIGVHLEHGKLYLMLSRDIGSHLPAWAVFDIDLTTGAATELVIPAIRTGWFAEKRPEGTLRYALASNLYGASPLTLFELDPATGTGSYEEFPCTGMACTTPVFHSVDGGETWDGYTQVQPNLPVCVTHWDVATVTATEACVNRPAWPAVDYNYIPTMMFRGTTPYMAWSTGANGSEQAYATALIPGNPTKVSETLMLGPGKITTGFRTGSMVRYRFASFELIEKPGGIGYLARLADAGPERVEFPVTPCVVDEGCGFQDDGFEGTPTFGYGQVQWILPLEGGEYLVFYTTVLDAHGKQAIYMAHERPRFGPITGAVPPPGATVDLPAGAQPMNELERACAVYAGCGLFDPTYDYKSCLKQWITEDATRPGLVAARARFIAAATSCPSLSALATSSCPLECTLSGGTCGPGGTGPCSNEVPYVAGNCNTCDGSGNFLWCPGQRTFQVACGGGTVCSSGYGCALPGSNACLAYPPACVSGDVRICSASQQLTLEDCSLEGAMCEASATTVSCVPTSTQGACSPATYGMQCVSGTHLLTCAYGQIRYVACSDLGYTECIREDTGALCH